uniref:Uncharacterized protein n=1 Tax=Anguilla anguilla TaxID=7936 RepID=A0A0E9SV41_ANGAN
MWTDYIAVGCEPFTEHLQVSHWLVSHLS